MITKQSAVRFPSAQSPREPQAPPPQTISKPQKRKRSTFTQLVRRLTFIILFLVTLYVAAICWTFTKKAIAVGIPSDELLGRAQRTHEFYQQLVLEGKANKNQ